MKRQERNTHGGPEKPTAHRGVISYISQLRLMWAGVQNGKGLGWNSKRRRGDDVIRWRVLKRTLCFTTSMISLFFHLSHLSTAQIWVSFSTNNICSNPPPYICNGTQSEDRQRSEAWGNIHLQGGKLKHKASRDLGVLLFPCAVLEWNIFSGTLMEQQGKIALLSIFISHKVPSRMYVT